MHTMHICTMTLLCVLAIWQTKVYAASQSTYTASSYETDWNTYLLIHQAQAATHQDRRSMSCADVHEYINYISSLVSHWMDSNRVFYFIRSTFSFTPYLLVSRLHSSNVPYQLDGDRNKADYWYKQTKTLVTGMTKLQQKPKTLGL